MFYGGTGFITTSRLTALSTSLAGKRPTIMTIKEDIIINAQVGSTGNLLRKMKPATKSAKTSNAISSRGLYAMDVAMSR